MSRERSSTLIDDIRLLQTIFHAGIYNCRHGIVGILLNRIVHAAFVGTVACAVVIYAESTAYVDKVDVEAHAR